MQREMCVNAVQTHLDMHADDTKEERVKHQSFLWRFKLIQLYMSRALSFASRICTSM